MIASCQPVEAEKFYNVLLYGPNARRQGPNETVGAYAADMKRLVTGAYPITATFPIASQDKLLCDLFTGNLRSEIKKKILNKEPQSFQEAFNEAQKREARTYLLEGVNPTTPPTQTQYPSELQTFALQQERQGQQGHNKPDFQKQSFSPKEMRKRNYNRTSDTNKSKKFCRYCKKENHEIVGLGNAIMTAPTEVLIPEVKMLTDFKNDQIPTPPITDRISQPTKTNPMPTLGMKTQGVALILTEGVTTTTEVEATTTPNLGNIASMLQNQKI